MANKVFVGDSEYVGDYTSIESLISTKKSILKDHPEAKEFNIQIIAEPYSNGDGTIHLCYSRHETAEEVAKREALVKEYEERRRETYEKLRKEFEKE